MIMKISCSQSVTSRSRCKRCSTVPTYGFFIPSRVSLSDPLQIKFLKEALWRIDGLKRDYYLKESPKSFSSIAKFAKKINFNKVGIRYHQYYGLSNKICLNNMGLFCACGRTCWVVPMFERDHVRNRKARILHPLEIMPLM
mgnify:CR=1 FL=1